MGVDLIFFEMMCRAAQETRGGAACSARYPDFSQDGFIIQGLPFNMYNRGFYNINPTWSFARFNEAPVNAGIYVVARRREVKPIKFPMQRKYRASPGLGT